MPIQTTTPTSPRLAEAEWRQARATPGPMQHPAARQPHVNDDGAEALRAVEWRMLRPTDHERRKAMVGGA